MLTGGLPFKGDYEQAVIYSILNEEIDFTNLPEEVIPIFEKVLAKSPDDRFQDISELIDELENNSNSTTLADIKIDKSKNKLNVKTVVSIVSILTIAAIIIFFILKTDDTLSVKEVDRKMIVVMPFKNLGSAEDEYFSDGITEEITARLSEIKQLGVIGRTSSNRYKNTGKSIAQIGEELNVQYLLEGTVRWEKIRGKENKVRVTPQLINISDGTNIWTNTYDAILESVFDVQTDVAQKVAKALNVTLLESEEKSITQKPTDSFEAYDFYLRANDYYKRGLSEENMKIAETMFLRATKIDPDFTQAFTRLAQIQINRYWFYWDRNKNRLDKAKEYIDRAKKINPGLPEVYLATGQYHYHGFLNYPAALIELNTGLEISPNNSELLEYTAYVKRRQGKMEETLEYLKRSLELDPLSGMKNFSLGETYVFLRRYEDAEKFLKKSIAIVPEWSYPHIFLANLYILDSGEINKAYQILLNSLEFVTQEKELIVMTLIDFEIMLGQIDVVQQRLKNVSLDAFDFQHLYVPKFQIFAEIFAAQNKHELKNAYYDSSIAFLEAKLKLKPDDSRLYCALGNAFAGLGENDNAIRAGRKAVELVPISIDAVNGFYKELELAKIYTMIGEYDLAIDKIDYLLSIPGELSVEYIKVDPVWKPLFTNSRLHNILDVHSLAIQKRDHLWTSHNKLLGLSLKCHLYCP